MKMNKKGQVLLRKITKRRRQDNALSVEQMIGKHAHVMTLRKLRKVGKSRKLTTFRQKEKRKFL